MSVWLICVFVFSGRLSLGKWGASSMKNICIPYVSSVCRATIFLLSSQTWLSRASLTVQFCSGSDYTRRPQIHTYISIYTPLFVIQQDFWIIFSSWIGILESSGFKYYWWLQQIQTINGHLLIYPIYYYYYTRLPSIFSAVGFHLKSVDWYKRTCSNFD